MGCRVWRNTELVREAPRFSGSSLGIHGLAIESSSETRLQTDSPEMRTEDVQLH
jgi:hypothetical protein